MVEGPATSPLLLSMPELVRLELSRRCSRLVRFASASTSDDRGDMADGERWPLATACVPVRRTITALVYKLSSAGRLHGAERATLVRSKLADHLQSASQGVKRANRLRGARDYVSGHSLRGQVWLRWAALAW